ncbi:hypothetical protein MAPG_01816 [Magnaporthiopsis poae ATCC 64411]|uniref:NACHT-NTPase and P-loop NTPases N-terminal domain-containing protein n=1 Tax=Magnaporthiopsis poae (strain ATCC 64411 / 73-15) TaxID=644358 RepID=A0A0C4DPP5_MAGP6|nr:hypothetical protein MAPG_01816 [Magnaporthiopsis poae ATCC 64411]
MAATASLASLMATFKIIFSAATAIIEVYKVWDSWQKVPLKFQELLQQLVNVADKVASIREQRYARREGTSHSKRLNAMADERKARILVNEVNEKFKAKIEVAMRGKKMHLTEQLKSWFQSETHEDAMKKLLEREVVLNTTLNGFQ